VRDILEDFLVKKAKKARRPSMPKIISYQSLLENYQEVKPLLNVRMGLAEASESQMVLVCGGTGCQSSDSKNCAEFQRLIAEHGLQDRVEASIAGCFGFL
jgi:hypothetical protein